MKSSIEYKFNLSVCRLRQLFSESPINAVYLFGSFRNGTATEASDMDLIAVSDIYNGLSGFIRRRNFLSHFACASLIPLDPKCLTVEEFKLFTCSEAYAKEKPRMIYCLSSVNE